MPRPKNILWQAANSDYGKGASTRVSKPWGGRYADGSIDAKKPKSFFKYLTKSRNDVYKYSTRIRKKWPSYGKVYRK